MLFFLGQSSLGFLPRPYWLHLTQCRLSRLVIWLDERMETRMLKYTMLHTTGYQKLLYDKEYTHHTWNLIINTCHLWGSQWPSVHFLPGPVIFSYLGGNSEEQLLKTDSRPTVGRQSADRSTELAHYQLSSSIARLLADSLRSVGHGKLRVTCR